MKLVKTDARAISSVLAALDRRLGFDSPEEQSVREIIAAVRARGDRAITELTSRFDGIDLQPAAFEVGRDEWERIAAKVPRKLRTVIDTAAGRLESFFGRSVCNSWYIHDEHGSMLGTRILPLERVLVYAPGGKAVYPSSVLMGAIPARIAGVKDIILTTPQRSGSLSPAVLYAALRAGVTRVFRIGGAHAVAGFAFGTKTLPRVDKIVGPGNIFVALAKKLLYGVVDIDMVAGPSEVLVIFDGGADTTNVAQDMLSQLEHDEMAIAVAVTDSLPAARRLEKALLAMAVRSERRDIIAKSLANTSIIVVPTLDDAVAIANRIAPEHLEVMTRSPFDLLPRIVSAGAVFLGDNTPEAVGDYMAGPNHILPTGGTARFYSPLGVESFLKRMSVLSFTREGIEKLGPSVAAFATEEGLHAHAGSVLRRLGKS